MGERQERTGHRAGNALGTTLGWLAAAVKVVGGALAVVLVVHVVLTVGNANPDNAITRFFADWAEDFALAFRDLFTPDDAKLAVLVNYGLAALFWLAIAALLSRLLRRFSADR